MIKSHSLDKKEKGRAIKLEYVDVDVLHCEGLDGRMKESIYMLQSKVPDL